MEHRRRVKEQLKKMGGLEYWDVGFSYRDLETGAETYVGLPECGGGHAHHWPAAAARVGLHARDRHVGSGRPRSSRCS